MTNYRHYFDIDPEYFPAVNADVIKNNPELWKKFFPHSTFIKLIKDTVNVLSRKQKLNIWVEGAYGTGKSYAVLTLKRLLDADENDTQAYFEHFHLEQDLLNQFINVKKQGKILTVHRYGSSSIMCDNDLFLAIQESIEAELKEAGIDNKATSSLRDAVIQYLSEEENKKSFEVYVRGSYSSLFGGESVDTILNHLAEYNEEPLATLMSKIFKLANDRNIRALYLTKESMSAWIKEVIDKNNLQALIFIWDEFSEYFSNNEHKLSGYQELLEISETYPFCFIPVTHKSEALIADADKEKTKIIGRFVRPYCIIELPENIAFQLMGAAMLKKKNDPVIQQEWQEILLDLCERTHESRNEVKKMAKINDKEMENILPIHPYSAVLLKHIAASFDSNQRSMFDFIKNDRGDEIKGFQWYIDNCGPDDENPLLTIDMLWSFFYDMGKDNLSSRIRIILDYYPRLQNKLEKDECRILKAVLLMQAMSLEVKDSVDLFLPDEKNLNNAFEGSDLSDGAAVKCAEKLVRDTVLYKKTIGQGNFVYSILTGSMDVGQIEEHKKQFESKSTVALIQEGNIGDSIALSSALKLRYRLEFASLNDFDVSFRKILNQSQGEKNNLFALVTFAKDNDESASISNKIINKLTEYPNCPIIFIDCGKTPLGKEQFADWVDNKAKASYFVGKDYSQSTQYNTYATTILNKWKTRISQGQFVIYNKTWINGELIGNMDLLLSELSTINRKHFPLCLENYKVIDNMWKLLGLKLGVQCGLLQKVESTYRSSNPSTKLETALNGAWEVENYWENQPSLQISRIKINFDKYFDDMIQENGRISIRDIYVFLQSSPYGFMPCNLSAFIIGFLLKEQVLGGKYTWSDGTVGDELSVEKCKEMVEEIIKNDTTPIPRYKEKYIVAMTEEEKSFINATSTAFGISRSYCSSVESARERIRNKMKDFCFPIWTLSYIIDEFNFGTKADVLKNLINLYCGIANNVSSESGHSDTDIAAEIGRECMNNKEAANDLAILLTKDNCTSAMEAYLRIYENGLLISLSSEISDGGQYINALRLKFDADAANWVWKEETVNQRIEDLICEYRIVAESNKIVDPQTSYKKVLDAWTEKCKNLRLSYKAIQPIVGNLDALLSQLYYLNFNGKIQDAQKLSFLENIRLYGEDFKQFYAAQLPIFKKISDFYISDLTDSDIDALFLKVRNNCFTKDKTEYMQAIESLVSEFKKTLGSQKIRALWKEKTDTSSPLEWSRKFSMPIMAMINSDEEDVCRKAFGTINNSNADTKSIDQTLSFLENAVFWEKFSDENERNKAFIARVIGSTKSVMLPSINSVKEYLRNHITEEPYYWLGSSAVKSKIEEMAQHQYISGGYEDAFKKIDSMPSDDVKNYLKELIKNNMNVGIEIILSK